MARDAMRLQFSSNSQNESFARVAVAAFAARLNPTMEEISDIKTAVSEAVTNSIIHGYEKKPGDIVVEAAADDGRLTIGIVDYGCGIEDIAKAMEPLYTSKPGGERSGIGFTVMGSFMDDLKVISEPGKGTRVTMTKRILGQRALEEDDEQKQIRKP